MNIDQTLLLFIQDFPGCMWGFTTLLMCWQEFCLPWQAAMEYGAGKGIC